MMLSLLLSTTTMSAMALAAMQTPVPSPPVFVPAPPSPPLPTPRTTTPTVGRLPTADMRPVEIEVEVRGGTQLLWQGVLRVANGRPASLRHEQTQAPSTACQPDMGFGGNQTSLTLSLSRAYGAQGESRFNLTGRWMRPVDERCESRGTRAVELNDFALLEPGASVTLNADGGLTVRLRRR